MIAHSEVLSIFPNLLEARVHYWSSDWGTEWTPHLRSASEPIDIAVVSGRSSKGHHPFLIVEDGERAYILAIAWSGNWRIKLEKRNLNLQIIVESDNSRVRVITSSVNSGGASGAINKLISDFRESDHHKNPQLLVEWNSWWPYEDVEVNEQVILENAKIAKSLGFEIVVLDAGWFGPIDADSHWHDVRGDWKERNTARFPNGLEFLGNKVRQEGIKFGIWLEIEAMGRSASLTKQHPEFVALRDGKELGYICFGNPQALSWAASIADNLVRECGAEWIKIDFNVDPGGGCNRDDHGHLPELGLSAHIEKLYQLLDDLKRAHPNLVVENCSSGGLRWDLGIAQHVDLGFASDPDWPEHALSVFWASSQFFPIEKLLSWCDSQWRGDHPKQKFTPDASPNADLEFALAITLLGGFGMSARLPQFPSDKQKLVAQYVELYKTHFRPRYQSGALVRHLTEQPERDELGARTVAFAIETEGSDPVIAIYQLAGVKRSARISYQPSKSIEKYRVSNLTTGEVLIESHSGEFVYENNLQDNCSILLMLETI